MKPLFNKKKNNKNKIKDIDIENNSNSKEPLSNPMENDKNLVISGYFVKEKSYKELVISRVNNCLCIVLGILVLFCLVCYYFVSCKEVQLSHISRATLELNYENEELQNKIDTLQSYHNIDSAVSKNNILERAKQVVEINAIDLPNLNFNNSTNKNKKHFVVSY